MILRVDTLDKMNALSIIGIHAPTIHCRPYPVQYNNLEVSNIDNLKSSNIFFFGSRLSVTRSNAKFFNPPVVINRTEGFPFCLCLPVFLRPPTI